MKRFDIEELKFKNLTFSYDEKIVFQNLTFDFVRSDPVILQGTIGGGKSTLMKLILGLLPITGGDYIINGHRVNELSFSEFDLYRLNMGFAFDNGGLINNRTLYENFMLPIEYHNYLPTSDCRQHINDYFNYFQLDEFKHLRPAFVSSGVRKAASLIKAFLLEPEIILLNNPTVGLNPEHHMLLVSLINDHKRNKNLKNLIVISDDKDFIKSINGNIFEVTRNGLFEIRHEQSRVA